jgi:hypothetical protein
VPQVIRPGPERARRHDDGRRLRREPESPRNGTAERSERRPLGALAPGDGRARRALAQVGPKLRALRSRNRLVQLFRDVELCFGARDRAFQLLAQRAPRTKDERLDRARGETQHLGDLGVRAPLDLAQDDRGTLVEGEMAERAANVLRRRPVLGGDLVRDVVVESEPHLLRAPCGGAEPLQAHVVRDLDQPVERRARILAALERLVRVEERRLRDVLCVGAIAQHPVRVAVDVRRVPPVEALE